MSERDRAIHAADRDLLTDCCVDVFRASGPGGQKRNKTSSAVRLRHPLGVIATATESRSQHENRTRALGRLREHLALDLREPVELDGYRPPAPLATLLAGSHTRRQRDEPAYLTGLAALLDLFVATGGNVAKTAAAVGLTTAALSRVIAADERLEKKVNELRGAR
jgi:hypothetical protein